MSGRLPWMGMPMTVDPFLTRPGPLASAGALAAPVACAEPASSRRRSRARPSRRTATPGTSPSTSARTSTRPPSRSPPAPAAPACSRRTWAARATSSTGCPSSTRASPTPMPTRPTRWATSPRPPGVQVARSVEESVGAVDEAVLRAIPRATTSWRSAKTTGNWRTQEPPRRLTARLLRRVGLQRARDLRLRAEVELTGVGRGNDTRPRANERTPLRRSLTVCDSRHDQ